MSSTAYSAVAPPWEPPHHGNPGAIHKGLAGQIRLRRIGVRHPHVQRVHPEPAATNVRRAPGAEAVHKQHHVAPLLERVGPAVVHRLYTPAPMQRHHGRKRAGPVGAVELPRQLKGARRVGEGDVYGGRAHGLP